MHFSKDTVSRYVAIVKDTNPLHTEIVPGQLIVEYIWQTLNIKPQSFRVHYQQPIMMDEEVHLHQDNHRITVVNGQGERKLMIQYDDL